MIKLSRPRVIFVEGETEFRLFTALKKQRILHAKKIVLKNFWDEDIKSKSINIDPNSDIIIIYDTDVIVNPDRFVDNVNFLIKRKHNVHLLQQTRNFEEELAYCCSIKVNGLFSAFCTVKRPGSNDFKRDFIACANPVQKLLKLGFDQNKWFIRNLHTSLASIAKNKSDFNNYFSVQLL